MEDIEQKQKALRTFILYILLILSAIASLQIFTGIADNGDYYRSYHQFILHPVDPRIAFKHWQAVWVLNPKLSFIHLFPQGIYFSSYQFLLAAQVMLNKLLYKHGLYSMILASMVPRALYLFLFFAICFELKKILQDGYLLVAVILLWLLFNDTLFVQFFNSFYQEQGGIIFFVGFFYCLLRISERIHWKALPPLLIMMVLFTFSKSQYVFTPFIAAVSFGLSAWYFKKMPYGKRLLLIGLTCLICQVPTLLLQMASTKHDTLSYVFGRKIPLRVYDAYEAYYTGALMYVPKNKLKKYAPHADFACVGHWTMDVIDGKTCLERSKYSYKDVLKLYIHHPEVFINALDAVRKNAVGGSIPSLSKSLAKSDVSFYNLFLFNIWNYNIGSFLRKHFYVIMIFLLLSSWFLKTFWRNHPQWFIANVFLLFFALYQYVMVLADGLHEAAKHALLANLAYMLVFLFVLIFSLKRVMSWAIKSLPSLKEAIDYMILTKIKNL